MVTMQSSTCTPSGTGAAAIRAMLDRTTTALTVRSGAKRDAGP